MDPDILLTQILLGGVLGTVGQGIRVVVGLKKTHDTAQDKNKSFSEVFETSQLVISLIIGFVAGVLAYISIVGFDVDLVDTSVITTLIGSGYAGTDFIEGFMKKYYASTP